MDETHQIIRKEHHEEVLDHIHSCTMTTEHHVLAALKRRNIDIFCSVLGKANKLPYNLPMHLLLAPPIYLHRCLQSGLDVNQFKRHNETFLEMAVRKQKVKHVERLLKHPRTKLTDRASNLIIKNKVMKKFMGLLFERGLPANPKYVTEALKKNDTELLQGALTSLEIHGNSGWLAVIEKLKCPILSAPTADMVQTPQGQIYDRVALTEWVSSNHTDPLTREELYLHDLKQRSEILDEILNFIRDATYD
jgi:hypothetical protein